jgi:Concanavalin A-like lectin/glucanases superfamily
MKTILRNTFLSALSIITMGAFFLSCSKSSNNVAPPTPIGGFNTSNDVGGANLLAHWSFDGTANESMSGTAPTTSVGSSFVTGVKGQALNLSSGYLLYPVISSLNLTNFGSITVSAWVNVDNNGSTASNVFSLTQGTATQTDWNHGLVNMVIETGHAITTDDTLVLHPSYGTYNTGVLQLGDNINDFGVRETDFKTVLGAKKWVHYVMRYRAADSTIDVFANGIVVSNKNFRKRNTGPLALPAIGTQALIGGFANVNTGFALSPAQTFEGLFTGSIDELRFFNVALSDADISSLYQLELAGR